MKIQAANAKTLLDLQTEKSVVEGYVKKLQELLDSDGEVSICVRHDRYYGSERDCSFDHYNYGMTFPRESRFIQPMIEHWKAKLREVEQKIDRLAVV